MKKLLSFSLALACAATLFAQNPKQDFKNNRDMAADSYWAYPGPTKQLTPAPEGYTPYYISHYGRHGSRWLINPKDYTEPVGVLQEADKAGKLTATGKDVLRKMELLADAAKGRYGELTQRGAEQHKGIALRMAHNFPEVFAGPTNIDAKSTVVIRCILSMENALHQLLLVNPQLNIAHDASYHDMYYMNLEDKKLQSRRGEESRKAFQAFKKKYVKPERVMNLLFNDKEYWKKNVDANNLFGKLIKNAGNVQSTELRHSISLWPLFNDTEIYNYWKTNNAWWYISYGGSPLSGGIQPSASATCCATSSRRPTAACASTIRAPRCATATTRWSCRSPASSTSTDWASRSTISKKSTRKSGATTTSSPWPATSSSYSIARRGPTPATPPTSSSRCCAMRTRPRCPSPPTSRPTIAGATSRLISRRNSTATTPKRLA